jgi:hypothetical protein
VLLIAGVLTRSPVSLSHDMKKCDIWGAVQRGIEAALEAGEFRGQGGDEWIVIRRLLWGHNDTPCGWLAPGQPIGRPGSDRRQSVIGVL